MPGLDELFAAMGSPSIGSSDFKRNRKSVMDDLESAQNFVIEYNRSTPAPKPCDLLQWKPGMKNRKTPEYGQPVMVLETMEGFRSTNEDGTPYGLESLDLRALAFQDTDGEWMPFAYDSHRFEPYKPEK